VTSAVPASMVPTRPLVLGLGVTGAAVTRALVRRGIAVSVTDDGSLDRGPELAARLGARWVDPPAEAWDALVASHDAILPSPGVPERHPIFASARRAGVAVRSEFDLAAAWDDRPTVLITGTNGKTTVTTLVTDMLISSGIIAVPAGNVEVPLVEAIDNPSPQVFVVEASSFRLTFASWHHPVAATWLNFAPDHLDVHLGLAGYEEAKARVWANHRDGGMAIANADDPVVMRWAPPGERTHTFSVTQPADWDLVDGRLRGPGLDLLAADELPRHLPHDLANALAAAATATAAGANLDGIRAALRAFRSLPHRVELVGEAGGVRWFDDSKATAPHATVAALSGFASAVLIAGGRNKGLDLAELRPLAPHLRAVVAIGEASGEVVEAFAGHVPTAVATSMAEAVVLAGGLALPGDVVVLSPACASFDWYDSYAERGDAFSQAVREHLAVPR